MTATASLERLFRAIANHDHSAALSILERKPSLTMDAVRTGAARADAKAHFLTPIARYTYTGDTALHIAAAAYDATLVKRLLAMGADANARNRLGATPLHAASDGQPDVRTGIRTPRSRRWPNCSPRASIRTFPTDVE